MDQSDQVLLQITKQGLAALGNIQKQGVKIDHSKRTYSAEMKRELVKILREQEESDDEIIDTLLDLDQADEEGALSKLFEIEEDE